MDNPSVPSLSRRFYNEALRLRNESERMLFLAVFAALGAVSSIGVGYLFHYLVSIPFSFIVGATLSSFILLPLFILLGTILWSALSKKRALSGDDFDALKYLKDEFERDVREVQQLPFSEADKRKLIREKYDAYMYKREMLKARIQELGQRKRSKYYLGD